MTETTYEYRLQFNNDEASCQALQTMVRGGWSVKGFKVEDGYTLVHSSSEGLFADVEGGLVTP